MSSPRFEETAKGAWATGLTLFAGIMLATLGLFQVFNGLAAVLEDQVYVAGIDYVWQFDLTTWGWIHLILGVVAVATGLGLMYGQDWARLVGLGIGVLVALAQFMFLPYFPFWSITIIAMSIGVMWALCVGYGRD